VGFRKRVILVAIFVLLPFGAIWGWQQWRSHVLYRNHEFAYHARMTLRRAQFAYIAGHPAGSGERNLWTQDVAGLYQFGLIDRLIAEADDRPVRALVPKPISVNGYYARFLPMDEVTETNGVVSRKRSFAYCLHPAEPGVTGEYIILMDEGGQFRCCSVGSRPVPTRWPSDGELRTYWSIDCGG